jgi:hypothetical protein
VSWSAPIELGAPLKLVTEPGAWSFGPSEGVTRCAYVPWPSLAFEYQAA